MRSAYLTLYSLGVSLKHVTVTVPGKNDSTQVTFSETRTLHVTVTAVMKLWLVLALFTRINAVGGTYWLFLQSFPSVLFMYAVGHTWPQRNQILYRSTQSIKCADRDEEARSCFALFSVFTLLGPSQCGAGAKSFRFVVDVNFETGHWVHSI